MLGNKPHHKVISFNIGAWMKAVKYPLYRYFLAKTKSKSTVTSSPTII